MSNCGETHHGAAPGQNARLHWRDCPGQRSGRGDESPSIQQPLAET